MKSLLDQAAHREIHARIEKLHAEQMPGWGKWLWHKCSDIASFRWKRQ